MINNRTLDTTIEKLAEIIPKERLMEDEPMSRHTSFRIGGPAALFVQVNNEEELAGALNVLRDEKTEFIIAGNGSNLLVADEGYPGVVVKLGGDFEAVTQDENDECLVTAGAARLMSSVSAFLCERGLSGFEFASGIPGSIGGAVFMNAGAYGGEMKDVIESVRVMPLCHSEGRTFCHSEERSDEESEIRSFAIAQDDKKCHSEGAERPKNLDSGAPTSFRLTNEDMGFGYRVSRAQKGGLAILSVTMRFEKDDPAAISERISELAARRNAKQPVNYPSAGSTFKRPAGGYAAALIEEAGLKGYRVGGACVSEKHAGFVINDGGASCEDVLAVMRHVRKTVFEKFGIMLEPEVRLINCSL